MALNNMDIITQPLTQSDISAVVASMQNSDPSMAAKIAMQKMLVTIASGAGSVQLSPADIFTALAAGAPDSMDRALYEALALECTVLHTTGALFIQGAGIYQTVHWSASAASWLVTQMTTLTNLATSWLPVGVQATINKFMSAFGVGTKTANDSSVNAASSVMHIMATSEAPILAALLQQLGTSGAKSAPSGGKGGGGGSSNSGSSSASGSASSSSSSSSSGSMDEQGIRTRRRLVRTGR
jgi:uncharacterized membrane protein YgcG